MAGFFFDMSGSTTILGNKFSEMMKSIFSLCLFLINFSLLAQVKFEKGFIVDESGQRKDAFIRNIEWANNPSNFQYSLTEGGEVLKGSLADIREFGIGEQLWYIRATVKVDRSSDRVANLSVSQDPEFSEETHFLQVLAEGSKRLYSFQDGDLRRYFMQTGAGEIVPLVWKRYLDGTRVAQNPKFRLQLMNSLKCASITQDQILKTAYTGKNLQKIFHSYNTCMGGKAIVYGRKSNAGGDYNLSVRAGLATTNVKLNYAPYSNTNHQFDRKLTARFGVEMEYVMPILRNKWAVIIEPGVLFYKNEEEYRSNQIARINYTSIELPVGIRYYLYLSDRNKLFFNGVFNPGFAINSTKFFTSTGEVEVKPEPNLSFGAGLQVASRFSLEVRHNLNRSLSSKYAAWDSKFGSTALMLGYKLF